MRNRFCLKGLPACPAVLGKIKRDKPYEKIYFKNFVGCLSCVRRGGLRYVFFLRKFARKNKNRTTGRRFDSRRFERQFERRFEKQSFGRRHLDSARERITLQISEAFRSYDVIDVMSEATTLDRLSYILKSAKGIVNAEDEPYIAASLGCANGIMRSPASKEHVYAGDRLQESVAAVRWQREVPAFAGGVIRESEELLPDTMLIKKTWFAPAVGKRVTQNAPAVLARNAAFPRVIGDRKP